MSLLYPDVVQNDLQKYLLIQWVAVILEGLLQEPVGFGYLEVPLLKRARSLPVRESQTPED